MKKTFLLVTVFCSVLFYAQDGVIMKSNRYSGTSPWSFGGKAGINASTITGDVDDEEQVKKNVEYLVGFHVGGFARYTWNDISLQPELFLSYQGSEVHVDEYLGEEVNLSKKISLAYLMFPILAQYHVSEKFRVEVGPQIGYNFTKHINLKGTIDFNGQEISVEEKVKDISNIDYSLNVGFAYKILNELNAYARFNQGLNSINTQKDGFFNWQIYNRVLMLGLEYEF